MLGFFAPPIILFILLYYKLSDEGTVDGLDAQYIDARVGDLVRKGGGELLIENYITCRGVHYDCLRRRDSGFLLGNGQ